MNFDEIIASIANIIGQSVAENIGVAFRAEAHRGMCAGSVNYCATPADTKTEYDVMQLVLASYEAEGRELKLDTPEACRAFMKTLFDVCKFFVRRNSRVDLAGCLTYEARAYKNGEDAWMCPVAKDRDFNRLNTPLALDKSLSDLKRAQKAAKRKPFDNTIGGEKVAQATFIRCEACGHINKIAET